jgi:hypothetical protein
VRSCDHGSVSSLEVPPSALSTASVGGRRRRGLRASSVANRLNQEFRDYERLSAEALRPHLLPLGFEVEAGKKKDEKIRRPVLFGELGREDMAYEVGGFQPVEGIALEVEAGCGARGNAVYRDLIEGSLLVDARYLALAAMQEYRHQSSGRPTVVRSYTDARNLLDAIYASS